MAEQHLMQEFLRRALGNQNPPEKEYKSPHWSRVPWKPETKTEIPWNSELPYRLTNLFLKFSTKVKKPIQRKARHSNQLDHKLLFESLSRSTPPLQIASDKRIVPGQRMKDALYILWREIQDTETRTAIRRGNSEEHDRDDRLSAYPFFFVLLMQVLFTNVCKKRQWPRMQENSTMNFRELLCTDDALVRGSIEHRTSQEKGLKLLGQESA